ncbi:SULT6B1 [Bugula neritina]|uniref:SULT6B1 n=1 Tax=Bugula neritina TaxID=10212 RepID=A0A7J7J708_BUGNE|nr:SULT6B1 [Bugula neritina]
MRNPKDTVCSYFPFLQKVRVLSSAVSWNTFFTNFIEGKVLYGSYAHFMKGWYPYRDMETVLNIQYEEMKKDLENNVRKIAEFLKLDLTEEQINKITEANTFESRKKEFGRGCVFYRKGKSGGWKAELTVEQNEVMDEWINTELDGMEDLKLKYGE